MRQPFRAIAIAVLAIAACSRHDDGSDAKAAPPASSAATTDALAIGELRIVSADSGVDLVLAHDSISGGLSQKTLATVRKTLDTVTVKSSDLGESIAKLVKSSVRSAIGARIAVPLAAVKDVRYEGGRLQFDWNGEPSRVFEDAKVNDKPVLESFRPEDAQRFVDAVRARKRALATLR